MIGGGWFRLKPTIIIIKMSKSITNIFSGHESRSVAARVGLLLAISSTRSTPPTISAPAALASSASAPSAKKATRTT